MGVVFRGVQVGAVLLSATKCHCGVRRHQHVVVDEVNLSSTSAIVVAFQDVAFLILSVMYSYDRVEECHSCVHLRAALGHVATLGCPASACCVARAQCVYWMSAMRSPNK